MALITASFVSLVRVRKQLEKAYRDRCWEDVRHWDLMLADKMTAAFDDNARDAQALIEEMGKVLNLYKKIVSEIPEQTAVSKLSLCTAPNKDSATTHSD